MNKLLHWTLLMTLGAGLIAQPQASNWLLGPNFEGKKVALTFMDDSVFVTDLPNNEPLWTIHEAVSALSDEDGNLSLYTNGKDIYNANGDTLLNSFGINTMTSWLGSSVTNGTLLLPFPGDHQGRFFVWLTTRENGPDIYKLQWSLIDLASGGAIGAIVDSVKAKNVWEFQIQEKLGVVRHANGRDWWIIARMVDTASYSMGFLPSDSFCLALLTPDGIVKTKTISANLYSEGSIGEMAISQDGAWLAEASTGTPPYDNSYVALYSLDRCSGAIDLVDSIGVQSLGAKALYGVAFDRGATRLYVSTSEYNMKVYQLRVSASGLDSAYKVYGDNPVHSSGQLELGPDGRIYAVLRKFTTFPDVYNQHLGVISFPSRSGSACGFEPFGIPLGVTMTNFYGLPPQPNYALGALEGSGCDTLGSTSSAGVQAPAPDWRIYPNPAHDRVWIAGMQAGSAWMLVDVLGRPRRSGVSGSDRVSVDLRGLPHGSYGILVWDKDDDNSRYTAKRLMVLP